MTWFVIKSRVCERNNYGRRLTAGGRRKENKEIRLVFQTRRRWDTTRRVIRIEYVLRERDINRRIIIICGVGLEKYVRAFVSHVLVTRRLLAVFLYHAYNFIPADGLVKGTRWRTNTKRNYSTGLTVRRVTFTKITFVSWKPNAWKTVGATKHYCVLLSYYVTLKTLHGPIRVNGNWFATTLGLEIYYGYYLV